MVVDEHVVAFVCERTGHDKQTVETVLAVEMEHLRALGLADPVGGDPPWVYYDPTGLPTAATAVDGHPIVENEAIARDVARFTAISPEIANEILNAEIDYLTGFNRTPPRM
jgi:hypothetical protein